MKTIKLNGLQLILLSTASNREDGSLLPAPDSVAADPKRVQAAITSLVRRKLAAKTDDQVAIADAGRAAIGIEVPGVAPDDTDGPAVPGTTGNSRSADTDEHAINEHAPAEAEDAAAGDPAPSPARAGSKNALVIALLTREGGATLEGLTGAAGWQPHTVRAALSGLRKKGHSITSEKIDGVRAWRIVS